MCHRPGLEYPALRIYQGDALALKNEAGLQLVRGEVVMRVRQAAHMFECGQPDEFFGFPHGLLPFFESYAWGAFAATAGCCNRRG